MPQSQESLQWLVVHTRPHQERKVVELLEEERSRRPNIVDIYNPRETVVRVQHGAREERKPIFAGKVFVLSTQSDLSTLLTEKYPEGYLEYDKTQQRVMTIPERQMLFFMDFNENYPEQVVVLERPYSDYAFNARNDAPNEAVMVADGPFAGKTGYLVKFRGNRRLVFQMQGMAVSLPDAWSYRLVRLHNRKGDRLSRATLKARIADAAVGMLQGCGLADEAHEWLCWLLQTLAQRQSFAALQEAIAQREQEAKDKASIKKLCEQIRMLAPEAASDLLSLADYARQNPEFLAECRQTAVRPFLTPTCGVPMREGRDCALLHHNKYMELMLPVTFTEPTFSQEDDAATEPTVSYYAHVLLQRKSNGRCTVMANLNALLQPCFLLGGAAREKQFETFRNYCPLLLQLLRGEHEVKVVKDLPLGNATISGLGIQVDVPAGVADDELPDHRAVRAAIPDRGHHHAAALPANQQQYPSGHLAQISALRVASPIKPITHYDKRATIHCRLLRQGVLQ